MCRSAPIGGVAPGVNHDLLNQAVPQIPDSSETWETGLKAITFLAAPEEIGLEAAGELVVVGGARLAPRAAAFFLRASKAGYRLHGPLPNAGQLRTFGNEALVELREVTMTSIATREGEMLRLGAKGAHANRLGEERRLLEKISEILRNRGIP
jgi:hypothetical protein